MEAQGRLTAGYANPEKRASLKMQMQSEREERNAIGDDGYEQDYEYDLRNVGERDREKS